MFSFFWPFWWRDIGPILEFKGSVRYIQKGHPTLVTQVDLILQNWWEFKVLVTVGLNRLFICTNCYGMLHFLQFLISSRRFWKSLVMVQGEIYRTKLLLFSSFFKKFTDKPPKKCIISKRILKILFKRAPTMVGQRRKFWYLERLKCLLREFGRGWRGGIIKFKSFNICSKPIWFSRLIHWPCTVPLRAGPWDLGAFVVGRMVLHWGNTHNIICKFNVQNIMCRNKFCELFALTGGAITWACQRFLRKYKTID